MADISKIKTLDGTTYDIKDTTARATGKVSGVKGNSESSYRTGNVNLTADNVGAIPANTTANTQKLVRANQLNGCNDVTLDAKINTLRANRLAFLPADQIIIEKTTDGGATWVDAGIADSIKIGLFSETRAGVSIPQINGEINTNCGLRITITAMKYNVPSGTVETSKYNYWNSNYILSTERYNQLKEMYFWVSSAYNSIGIKVERATGANSTTWNKIYDSDDNSYGMTGWSGNDYIKFSQANFGGGTNQTTNYWNYRFTFFSRGPGGSMTLDSRSITSVQGISEIRGYGDTWWTAGNEYAANDKMYTHDYQKNVTFPAKVTAASFSGSLTGNASTATKATQDESGNNIKATYASSMSISDHTITLKNKNGTSLGTVTVPDNNTTYTANTSKLVTTTVPNVTSVGSAPTLGTAIDADDITAWSAGSTPTLGTAIDADDITAWTANTPTSASVSNGVLVISAGSAASLSYTAKSIPNVTSVGSVPSLSYTAKSIPNVTSVGSAPTLGTAVTVATGSLAANGSGATVATGITAS